MPNGSKRTDGEVLGLLGNQRVDHLLVLLGLLRDSSGQRCSPLLDDLLQMK